MARGSIVKRGSTYSIVYRVGGRQKWETVGRNKKEAENVLDERLRNLRDGFRPAAFEPKLCRDVLNEFIEDHAKTRMKPSTIENWESNIRKYVDPALGSSPFHTITPQAINTLLGQVVGAGRSPRTANNIRVFRRICG